ncbi:hypothetical protein ACFU7T_13955 [Streptomyces sp. NPDC057555]|uniref:hypothetical protein n=1 Tax=Streptomyces sp. NPDC057555 TaxID=3346166 RepID=UPI00367E415A
MITTTTLAPPLVPRFGPKAPMTVGILLAIAGLLWLTRLDPGSGYATAVLPTQILVSVGVGLFHLSGPNVALSGVAPADAGVASAALNTSQQVGAALGPALLDTPYLAAVADSSAARTTAARLAGHVHGYRVAFTASAALFVLAFTAVTCLIRSHRSTPTT